MMARDLFSLDIYRLGLRVGSVCKVLVFVFSVSMN